MGIIGLGKQGNGNTHPALLEEKHRKQSFTWGFTLPHKLWYSLIKADGERNYLTSLQNNRKVEHEMTQQTEMVQTVQNLEELQNLKRPQLVTLMKQFKAEDTDCLTAVNGKSKNDELIEALAEHMGFTATVEAEIKSKVNNDIVEAVQNSDDEESDVMDFGEDVPSLQASLFGDLDPIIEEIMATEGVSKEEAEAINQEHLEDLAEQDANWKGQIEANLARINGEEPQAEEPPKATTGDQDVDNLLAELGLDGIDALDPQDLQAPDGGESQDQPQVDAKPEAEEKPKKPRTLKLPFEDRKRIPIRKYGELTLGMFGDILEPLDEPDKNGYNYDVLKLERFNSKAHEVFRNTKGHMHLVYTNASSTYMIVYKKPDGTLDPVLEVTNKGRGHLQSKQLANVLQLAYNEKNDQETISAEQYTKLAEQIELLPINAESVGL